MFFKLGIKQVNCIMRLLPLFSLVKKCPEVQGFLQKVYVFKKILYYTVMLWYIELYISDGFGYLKLGFKLPKIIKIFREIDFTKKYTRVSGNSYPNASLKNCIQYVRTTSRNTNKLFVRRTHRIPGEIVVHCELACPFTLVYLF